MYKKAKQIVQALEHELYDSGDAHHEYWNTWVLALDPYDMAESAEKFNLTIIGYFKLKEPKHGLDIGIVAEEKDGNRIWCHAKKVWFEDWKEEFPELYKEALYETI